MNFSLVDSGGLFLAILACGVLLVAPGFALARLLGMSRVGEPPDLLTGIVVGLAVLPALTSLAVRFCGLGAALGATLVLALYGVGLARRCRPQFRLSPIGFALVGAWLVLLGLEWIDFDVAGKLYQPLTIFDTVKHAATTQAIYDSGAPPRDAFFLRPERASYYYFFYTFPALVMRLLAGLVDAKAAVGGMVFWTGIGAYGLIRLVMDRAGLAVDERRRPLLIVAVMAAGGLDIVAVLLFAWTRGYWLADPLQWNEQVGAWLEDLIWVPHHVTCLVAGTVGLIALCDAIGQRDGPPPRRAVAVRAVALAALSFAATLGLSVWVTIGFGVAAVAWGIILLVERRWRAFGLLLIAGAVALTLATPQLLDLKAGRAGGGPIPIAAALRGFTPVELLLPSAWQLPAEFLLLPLNYAIEFGVLVIGSIVYWRQRRAIAGGEFARVLAITAVTGLLIGAFLRSTLFNNDLGWRVLLLPLLAGTAWTVIALDRFIAAPRAHRLARPAFFALMGLGWTTVLYMAVCIRTYPFMTVNPSARFMAADPATERSLRVAYGWASAHLSPATVLQQNPTKKRAFAFAVYGRNPIGVADAFGSLYGADPKAVQARLDALGAIFKSNLPASDIAARASANGVDALVVTAADPVWSQPASFVWRVAPIYASDRVRIIPIVTIEAAR